MNKLPNAKTNDLVVQNLNDEILIYNLTDNKAFCLNKTSAIVYQACDGETSFAELQKKSGFTEDLIHLTLAELEKQGFLEIPADYVSPLAGMSRREMVRKVGLATMIALPVISSIVAPSAINAASGNCVAPNNFGCTGVNTGQGNCCDSNQRCAPFGFAGGPVCQTCIPSQSVFQTGLGQGQPACDMQKGICCNNGPAIYTNNFNFCLCT